MDNRITTLISSLIAVCVAATDGRCDDKKEPPKEASPTAARLYDEGIPETGFFTLKTDNYTLPMDAASGWTIEKMSFAGHQFGLSNGHYGTVLIPQGGKWWGTGHKEGGREVVHALSLTVDGEVMPIQAIQADGLVKGKHIKLVKDSTIWKFKTRVEIVLTNDYIYERTQMEAIEDCATDRLYYFMHSFPPTTTRWIAQLPDGSTEEGPLQDGKERQVNKDTRWTAQYDPSVQLGYLCYTPTVISGPKSQSMIWNLDRYHKYYLRQNEGQTFKKGEKLDFSVLVKAVAKENGDWSATKDAAEKLMKQFPAKP